MTSTTNSTYMIYQSGTSDCYSSTGTILTVGNPRKVRGKYKKEKFEVTGLKNEQKTEIGKIRTLQIIGEMLETLELGDTMTLTIKKVP